MNNQVNWSEMLLKFSESLTREGRHNQASILKDASKDFTVMQVKYQKLYALANILIKHDTGQECPYCPKTEWGNDKHDPNCPFAIAYKILSGEDDNEQ